jgi:hypothetical protein
MAIEIDRADTVQLVHDIVAATGLDVEEVVYQAVFEHLVSLVGLERARQIEASAGDSMQPI